MNRSITTLVAAVLAAGLAACSGASQAGPQPGADRSASAEATSPGAPPARAEAPQAGAALPRVLVHKDPNCGCCSLWAEHMRREGFEVELRDVDDLAAVRERAGVPAAKASCHTALVGDYFVEGHVPAADVRRLLAERPDALGITAPGMPLGSPGMEMPNGRTDAYSVELVHGDGSTTEFARHGE
ncbi:DUF411 domain-containing protein [Luteimonas sp. RD2P54]|uniref:DUF411 domain-containing protein n=1 Tax=Luteimonas endophytica TaxID=3042023 RepID=A0ABT6JAC3_9GAMM|nr:DUF411 domain-containing protein [Luteimonas endophytica]MDH5823133.1 DUF411 domain-containing protein [Luteimonas endophytica]